MANSTLLTFAASCAAVLSLGACSSSTKQSTHAATPSPTSRAAGAERSDEGGDDWLEPSPQLASQIEVRSHEVEVISTLEDFVRLSDWFQNVGEPAYPKLLDMAQSRSRRSKEFALSVISAMADPRLLKPFKEQVMLPARENANHRYEYARALLRMGDLQGAPILIEGLEDDEPMKRQLAYKALVRSTRNEIPFDANAPAEERVEAVTAWRDWYEKRTADPMLD